MDGNRFYNDCAEEEIEKLFCAGNGYELLDMCITEDSRDDRKNQRWINAVGRKMNYTY